MKKLLFALLLAFTLTNCNSQNFFWSYNNLTGIKYGKLYNWYAATDSRGIAPSGWHVPTKTELDGLITYLGASPGGQLKEVGFTYWDSPNTGASDAYGFSLRGAGYRGETGTYGNINLIGYIWTSTAFLATSSWLRFAQHNTDGTTLQATNNKRACSIRLIKDDSTNTGTMTDFDGNVYPTVTIGSQVWMAANLIVEHYNNGDAIPNVTDNTAWSALTTGAWCHYDNDSSNQ